MASKAHAVAAQKWLNEPFADTNQALKDGLLGEFHAKVGSREILVGPIFHSHSFIVMMENSDGVLEEVQKNYIVWVAKTTNFKGEE